MCIFWFVTQYKISCYNLTIVWGMSGEPCDKLYILLSAIICLIVLDISFSFVVHRWLRYSHFMPFTRLEECICYHFIVFHPFYFHVIGASK